MSLPSEISSSPLWRGGGRALLALWALGLAACAAPGGRLARMPGTPAGAAPASPRAVSPLGRLLANLADAPAPPAAGASEPAEDDHLATALSVDAADRLNPSHLTASSSLDPAQALRLAKLVCACTPRSSYCFILPTGSMQPLFGEKVILLLETAPFETLHVGDIVTYRHPQVRTLVVHRLVAADYERFRSQGDANRNPDDVYVTRDNYRQRVFGIIYSRSPLIGRPRYSDTVN